MSASVRLAAEPDLPVLLDLVDALADYEKLPRPTPEARERLARDGFGPDPLYQVLIAELDRQPAGYAIFYFTYSSFLARPTLFLEDLFVLPRARRRGLAAAVFRRLAEEAMRRECGRMEWIVLDWNQLAIDFYERLGARRLAEWHTYRLDAAGIARLARDRA